MSWVQRSGDARACEGMDSLALVASVWAMLTVAHDVYTKASQDSRLYLQSRSFQKELWMFEHNLAECVVYSASSLDINAGLLAKFDQTTVVVQKRLQTDYPQRDTKNVKRLLAPFRTEPKANKGLVELTQLLHELNKGFKDNTQSVDPDNLRSNALNDTTSPRLSTSPTERDSVPRSPMGISSSTNAVISASDEMSPAHQPVQGLWNASADALSVMLNHAPPSGDDAASIKAIRDRVYLWGTGLFSEGDLHLDELISGTDNAERFREPLASHFIEIIMAQVQIIERWTTSGSRHGYNELRAALTDLKSTLVGSKMTKKLLEDFIYHTVKAESPDDETSQDLDLDFLRQMVEILFDYLPAISRLRQRHILRTPELDTQSRPTDRRINQKSSTDEIIDEMQKLEHLLIWRETIAKDREVRVTKFSSRAARERQTLSQLNTEEKRGPHVAPNNLKIEQVQRTLSDRLRETNQKLSSSESVLLKKRGRIKASDAEVGREIKEEENYIKETLRKVGEVTVILRARRPTV